jgi:hypothetical protein
MITRKIPSVALFETNPAFVRNIESAVPRDASLLIGAGTGDETIACGILVLSEDGFSPIDGTADAKGREAIVQTIERYLYRLTGAPLVVVRPAGTVLEYAAPQDCVVISASSLETDLWRNVRRLVLHRDLEMLRARVLESSMPNGLQVALDECFSSPHLVSSLADLAKRLGRSATHLSREWEGEGDDDAHGLEDAVAGIHVLRVLARRAEQDPHKPDEQYEASPESDDRLAEYATGLSLSEHDADGTFRHKLLVVSLLLAVARREALSDFSV